MSGWMRQGSAWRWAVAGSMVLCLAAGPAEAATCTARGGCAGTTATARPEIDTILTMLAPDSPATRKKEGLGLLEAAARDGDVRALVQLAMIHADGRLGLPVDKARAADLFGKAAQKGDNFARVQLALLLLNGTGVAEDVPRGVKLLEAANKAGDVWATTLLADLYIEGRQVAPDGDRAIALLTPLVTARTPSALTSMGDVYARGPAPVAKDETKAFHYYERAALFGDITGKSRLGTILVSRAGKPADVNRGLRLLADVARAGDAWTLIQIGNLHAAGVSVPLDGTKALDYYRRAADAGLPAGFSLMGNVYRYGLGTIASDAKAAAGYYEKALAGADNTARVQLALMLLDGTSLPLDVDRAVGLLQDAQKTGDVWSATLLAGLYTAGDKVKPDGKLALALLEPLVAAGNGAAMTALGDVYAKGPAPVKADARRAVELYDQAAALGDIGGKSRLGTILTGHVGQVGDVSRGLSLLEEVAAAGDNWTLIQIGNLHAAGASVPLDGVKALAYYERAARAGLAAGYSLMGNAYKFGLGSIARDPAKAARYYEKAIAAKDNTGRVQLALMLLDGSSLPLDIDRAVGLLKDAAATGDLWSTSILANLYAEGRLVQAQYIKARSYYDAAYAMGNREAALQFGFALATGPLSSKHADEGVALVRSAVDAGVAQAAVTYARLQVAGLVRGENARDANATLQKAIGAGDALSLRYMIDLYHYGVPGQITPQPTEVQRLLERHGEMLPPEDRAFDAIYVETSRPMTPLRLRAVSSEFDKLRPQDVPRTMQFLLQASPNAYVYVLQRQMGEDSIYSGPLNGTLTRVTLRAIARVCRQIGVADVCIRGVLTGEAAGVLSNWLASAKTEQN